MRQAAFAGALALLSASAAPAQPAQTWDFEDGTLQGWTATGNAFVHQPTFGNNVVFRRPGELAGQEGNYWIGTYENHPRPFPPAGQVQGDGPQGTLTSPPFAVERGVIWLRLGGGNDDWQALNEYVGLIIKCSPQWPCDSKYPEAIFREPDGDYQLQFADTGRNVEFMNVYGWDTEDFLGQTARMVIVDRSSAPWGHINVDDIRFSWAPPHSGAVPGGTRSILPRIRIPGPDPAVVPHGPNVRRLINGTGR